MRFLNTRWLLLLSLGLLATQLVVQIRLSSLDSQSTDEVVHVSAGYTYLTRGDFRFNPEHPPLVKILSALPLLALQPNINEEAEREWRQASDRFFYDSWQQNRVFGEEMLYNSGNDSDALVFWSRIPIVFLTLLLGLAVLVIARRHWGESAGLVATALYVFNPTVNGHGHLVTTDIALALGFLLTLYAFWHFVRNPSWKNSLLFGLAFGFALLVKHTAIILLPVLVILGIIYLFFAKEGRKPLRVLLPRLGFTALVVIFSIWLGFGFQDGRLPTAESFSKQVVSENLAVFFEDNSPSQPDFQQKYEEKIAKLTNFQKQTQSYDSIYQQASPYFFFLPATYLKGLALVLSHTSSGHWAFLLGEVYNMGWWYYFPVVFLFKTPLAMLILFGAAIYLALRRWRDDSLTQFLLLGGALYFAAAIQSNANLGIRHIMPVFPLLALIGGYAVTMSKKYQVIAKVGLIWLAGLFIMVFPAYLSYFNELSGGKENSYLIATDSNLDWGHDLKRIARYISENEIENVYIEYGWLGTSALDRYLGKDNYKLLKDYDNSQDGYAILGASAIHNDQFNWLLGCEGMTFITNGVIGCPLSASR